MRTAKPCLLILISLLAALVVATTTGADLPGGAGTIPDTISVRDYQGWVNTETHPGAGPGCKLCEVIDRLLPITAFAIPPGGGRDNGDIVLRKLTPEQLLALEKGLLSLPRWQPRQLRREGVLAIIRHHLASKLKDLDISSLRALEKNLLNEGPRFGTPNRQDALAILRQHLKIKVDDADRRLVEPVTAKLRETGIEYLVHDPKGTATRLVKKTLIYQGDPTSLLDAVASCDPEVRPDLLKVAATWPHVTADRLRRATHLLTTPLVQVKADDDLFRLVHPKRGPPLELPAIGIPTLPQEWKDLPGPWLVERTGLNGEQVKKLAGRLRALAIKNNIPTPTLVQGERSRQRLASPPEKEKARLVIDDTSLSKQTDVSDFLDWLIKLAAASLPDRKIYLLFGHDERKPDGALSRWTKLAEDKQFEGAHVIFCICNDSPRDLQVLANVALEHGALSVVVTTEHIDIPAMSFAASSFMRIPLPEDDTPLGIWEACYKDALKRLDLCRAIPTEAEAAAAIRREFGDMGEYLLTPDRMGPDREKIDKLRKVLQEQPRLFGPLAHDQRPRIESRTLARK